MGLNAFWSANGALVLAWLSASAVLAQEGFPLDGTWRGQWGSDSDANTIVMVMKWDGDAVNGTLNPGPGSIPFTAILEPETWTVRIDVERAQGPVTIEGTLKDIGSYNRYIEGTWRQDGTDHDFRLTRE